MKKPPSCENCNGNFDCLKVNIMINYGQHLWLNIKASKVINKYNDGLLNILIQSMNFQVVKNGARLFIRLT